jgi:hypothetical protein
MLCNIVDGNWGSYSDVHHFSNPRGGLTFFKDCFFLGACVRSFQFYLRVICIDGTFLIKRYKGQILTIVSMNRNHQILSLAFALIESGNTNNLYWFLERVNASSRGTLSTKPKRCLGQVQVTSTSRPGVDSSKKDVEDTLRTKS